MNKNKIFNLIEEITQSSRFFTSKSIFSGSYDETHAELVKETQKQMKSYRKTKKTDDILNVDFRHNENILYLDTEQGTVTVKLIIKVQKIESNS